MRSADSVLQFLYRFFNPAFLAAHSVEEQILALANLVHWHVVHQSVHTAIENSYLLAYRHWAVLRLNQQLVVLTATVQCHCCYGIHIA